MRSVSFSDGGSCDRDIIFRDRWYLVFCFLGRVVKFQARKANSWWRSTSSRLITRGYPHEMIQTTLSEVNFAKRQSALQQKKKTRKQILPLVTTYHPSVRNLKNILMQNWNLIQNQPLLKNIFKDPPIISYKRGQSLKDMLVRAKI